MGYVGECVPRPRRSEGVGGDLGGGVWGGVDGVEGGCERLLDRT